MGTTAHCESYTPGYYSRDMNEDSNSSSWSPFHRDKNLLTGHYYNGFVQRTVRDECAGYEKDVLKQKMMEHEMVFKNQVYELHRLYRVQREMMEEAKRKELYNHHRSVEASSSSSIVPSQMSSDEVRNWHTSSFPLASPSKTYRLRVSNVGISTSLNFRIQGHNLLLAETEGPYTVQQNYTSLDIHVGQTYSFLLSTDQNASTDYYIVESARFVNESVWRRVTGVGILRYSNSKGKASGPLPEAPQDQFDKTFLMNQARSIRWNVSASDARPNPQSSF
ncbi:hypothetical protein POM88_052524 [Heracleum sosnowskyi]|uniref:Plastocyanin-like domain-containing protein n=1 Tax=Heracleum sosnowskyi TaxID=360622 RepID=A0AAD8LYY5_9APIA|nr:hypothetical protein POM88_052524 [Heracleum sosnowskyi]